MGATLTATRMASPFRHPLSRCSTLLIGHAFESFPHCGAPLFSASRMSLSRGSTLFLGHAHPSLVSRLRCPMMARSHLLLILRGLVGSLRDGAV